MQVKKKDVFNRGEYGYFVVAKNTDPKVYAGLYNENGTKVYLISSGKMVDIYELVDLLKIQKGANSVKITPNVSEEGKGIPQPKSFMGLKLDKFYYCMDTVQFRGIEVCNIISYYNNNLFLDSIYGQNKYPSFSCSVKMLLNNEKLINKNIEQIIMNNYDLDSLKKLEDVFEKEEK